MVETPNHNGIVNPLEARKVGRNYPPLASLMTALPPIPEEFCIFVPLLLTFLLR